MALQRYAFNHRSLSITLCCHAKLGYLLWKPNCTFFFCVIVLFFFLNWGIVVLQCCTGFCHAMKWISCTHICLPSWTSLPVPHPQPSHPSRSSQSTRLSSLCNTALRTSHLFHTWWCVLVNAPLPVHPPAVAICLFSTSPFPPCR